MKYMLCFDLDGTLLNHKDFQISGASLEWIEIMKRKGHKVVLATGRDMDTVYSRKFALQIKPDAIVHANGSKITVGENLLFEKLLSRETVEPLIEFAKERKICIGAHQGERSAFTQKEKVIAQDMKLFGRCDRKFAEIEEILEWKLYAMALYGTRKEAAEIETAFPNLRLPMFAKNEGADIIPREISKAEGIQVLLEHYQMGWEQVMAFGDSMNDVEMLEHAGWGVAMGNAVPQAKAAADYITKSIEEEGISFALFQRFPELAPKA